MDQAEVVGIMEVFVTQKNVPVVVNEYYVVCWKCQTVMGGVEVEFVVGIAVVEVAER